MAKKGATSNLALVLWHAFLSHHASWDVQMSFAVHCEPVSMTKLKNSSEAWEVPPEHAMKSMCVRMERS